MVSDKILSFYKNLRVSGIPEGVEVMNPYRDDYTFGLCRKFYQKYYHDQNSRTLLLGINPGRFGSGMTGISFTDPAKLEKICGIENTFPKKAELSADFIYKMIEAFGGPEIFYRQFFISAASPLGFTANGKNINYYDDKKLEAAVKPFIIESIHHLLSAGFSKKKCFIIGEGKNFDFLKKQNAEQKWFDEMIPLPHPRFIMQYRRRQIDKYIDLYVEALRS